MIDEYLYEIRQEAEQAEAERNMNQAPTPGGISRGERKEHEIF